MGRKTTVRSSCTRLKLHLLMFLYKSINRFYEKKNLFLPFKYIHSSIGKWVKSVDCSIYTHYLNNNKKHPFQFGPFYTVKKHALLIRSTGFKFTVVHCPTFRFSSGWRCVSRMSSPETSLVHYQ